MNWTVSKLVPYLSSYRYSENVTVLSSTDMNVSGVFTCKIIIKWKKQKQKLNSVMGRLGKLLKYSRESHSVSYSNCTIGIHHAYQSNIVCYAGTSARIFYNQITAKKTSKCTTHEGMLKWLKVQQISETISYLRWTCNFLRPEMNYARPTLHSSMRIFFNSIHNM